LRRWRWVWIGALIALSGCESRSTTVRATVAVPNTPHGVDVTITASYYAIHGSTAQELREEMNRRGPGGYDAYTRWFVKWSYPTETTGNACDTGPVEASVEITYTMPEWDPPPNADAALVDRWTRYVAALQLHEDGHRDFGIDAAKDVLRAVSALPPYPTCADLNRAANAAAETVLDRFRAQEIDYDRTTSHGATQGARFP